MEPRSRGRARGRARHGPQPPGGSGASEAAWGPRPGAPPGPSAAAVRATYHQQAAPSSRQWVRPPAPHGATQTAGRGSRQGGGDDGGDAIGKPLEAPLNTKGEAGDRRGAGNGGVRGRTNRNEIICTKPPNMGTKKGTEGTPIRLKANFFPVLQQTGWCLNQYRVDFAPEIDDTKKRRGFLRTAFLNQKVSGYLFDGTVMYTPTRILPDPLELFVNDENDQNIRITVRLVGDVQKGDIHYLQLFNIIIRKCLAYLQLDLLGRNYFDSKSRTVIPEHNLELWPGYFTSMRQYERDIMLNTELTFKVMRRDNVYDLMRECRGRNVRQEFQQKIIGSVVLTYYNNKTYRIDDVDFNATPASSFTKRDGSSITYAQYFRERYNVKIDQMDQPMLVSRSKPREIRMGMPEVVYLVPSLCTMTGLTDRQRENFHLMKALGEYTRVGAHTRMQKLLEFNRRLKNCPQAMEEIRRWDLKLADALVAFEGRVLPQETLYGRNNQSYPAGEQADWTRSLRSTPMFTANPLETLAVICPSRLRNNAQEFVNCVQRAARGMSWQVNRFRIFDIHDDRSQSYLEAIENIITKDNPMMIMCVLTNNSADRYNAIKKKCYVDRAVPCQVIVQRNLMSKGVMSIATKVAIQMNCKLGGAPWATSMPKNTMVVGYDVCRDTANRSKSFAGMVASINSSATRYFNHAVEHEQEQELSANIASFLLLACRKYKEENHVYPERIIVYRDGVGDGQIPYVKEQEVETIKKMLSQEIYQSQPPKMAYIIVSKRINTRIFRADGAGPDFNPPPGTIADDVITLPQRYDFYIVSQCVRQGTVSPTSYNVIENTLGVDPNKLQRFTYKMCHMYFNWSGTVRVPAPCQYAHKLAFMTAQSLHRTAHRGLESLLYYL